MAKVPLDRQIACAERELAMRRNVYPKWTAAKRMTEAAANDEIEAMAAVVATLRLFAKYEMPVRATLENCLAEMRMIEADPAAQALVAEFPGAEVTVREIGGG